MSKAVSWTKAGSGFDAREAAREAARRQGKSLGEWLHGVIADNAADGHAGQPTGRDRIEALTTRLERMSAATRAPSSRARTSRPTYEMPSEPRAPQLVDDRADDERRPARTEPERGDAIEEAFATMERRTQRSERRTDEAIASVARLIESSERRRDRDRAGVESLADKLADIETRLAARDEAPIQGTLARLEARLDQIGRRGESEASARALAAAQMAARPQHDDESIRRLEDKLEAVLGALAMPRPEPVAPRPPATSLRGTIDVPEPARHDPPLRRRRLGDAIAEIAERQRLLEARPRRAGRQTDVEGGGPLSERLDEIRRGMTAPRASVVEARGGSGAPRGDSAATAEPVRDATPRDATEPSETGAAIGELRAAMRTMGGRLEQVHELASHQPGPDLTVLERLVRDLGQRMEAVQAGAGSQAIDGLEAQIGALATRLERTETGLAAVGTLERSMHALFAHLEDTRAFAETAASRAATEAVRTAVAEKGFDRPAPRADVAVLKAMQEDADLRTRATLDVVHEALDKVVDRLAVVEQGLAEARVARATRDEAVPRARTYGGDAPRTPPAPEFELAASEPLVDPRAGSRAKARKPAEVDPGTGRTEFIAAARRAAHAAQTDPSVVAIRRPIAAAEPEATRADLAVKSRDYVASHKRPVLMALAAVLMVAATMALMQRLPFGSTGPEVAEAPSPTQVASTAVPARPARPTDSRLDPMAAPTATRATPAIAARIPGSDPIVTGSIPSLPAFAARSPGAAPNAAAEKPPALPAGLVAAADAGDGAAEYTLASAYAEGRAVPRDFARAAKLYAQAADKGIVPAQYRLGALYEKGLGVARDKARARSLYRAAADAGSPRAMHNLAVLLADGDGKPDYEGAATWFRRAAQLGVHDSEFNLAILLARGLGLEQSLVQSYQWFAIAAQQGDADAAAKRDEVATKLSSSELSVAKALAAAFRARMPDPAAVDVQPPPGGWDGGPAPLHLNSARSKISSL